ncbi:UNVERIFIED_CONTAM: hypothetical protein HHA_271037 [Hammondia hammondi]|eukprot:XP_008882473.1 hypothetical protein HHA_271037 [Hammondia hammondi]
MSQPATKKQLFFYRNTSLRSTWLLWAEKTPVPPLGCRFLACLTVTLFGMCTLLGIGEIRHGSSPSMRVTAPSPPPLVSNCLGVTSALELAYAVSATGADVCG